MAIAEVYQNGAHRSGFNYKIADVRAFRTKIAICFSVGFLIFICATSILFSGFSLCTFSTVGRLNIGTENLKFIEGQTLKEVDLMFPGSAQRLLILQTSDGVSDYKKMLDISESVAVAYALKWGFGYMRWDGVLRGSEPWLATFNRIYLLRQLQLQGNYDWALYLDNDAIIIDPTYNASTFLEDQYAVIACAGGHPERFYDINIGVAFFNLKHPAMEEILTGWKEKFEMHSEEEMDAMPSHDYRLKKHFKVNDQAILTKILADHPEGRGLVRSYSGSEGNAFNYDGPFIRHVLRDSERSPEERLSEMRKHVSEFFNLYTQDL